MPIEINGSSTPQSGRAGDAAPLRVIRNDGQGARQGEAADATTDSISLTPAAGLMQRLDNQIAAAPAVDTARVNSIRHSIAEGSFLPDYARVADRLIDREIALFGATGV